MPKIVHDDVLDYGLDTIKTKVTRIGVFTTTPPSTISSAAPTALAITTASTGNFTIADSSVSGRKLTISQKSTIPITTTGTAGHILLFSSGSTAQIYYQTSCTTQVLGSTANSVTIPAWMITIADPT